jgi:Rrf2 family protein
MIYSRSAEYAIRSFVYLARIPDGKFAMARHIAKEEQIPAHFLAKILQELTRKGLLRSNKGPSGGFSLRVPANQRTSELRLLSSIERKDRTLAQIARRTIRRQSAA